MGTELCEETELRRLSKLVYHRPGGRRCTQRERSGEVLFLGSGQVGFMTVYRRTELKQFL